MKQLGFTCHQSDAGIFINKEHRIMVIAYVDDCVFLGTNLKRVLQAKAAFMQIWECWDLGKAKKNFRMRIKHEGYKIIKCFDMQELNTAYAPLPAGYEPEENKEKATDSLWLEYQSVIRSLLYIMIGTRPDISFAVTKMAQFSANPSPKHLQAAKHIITYLKMTGTMSLIFDGASNKGLIAFTDSDWASDKIKCWSQTGYFFQLAEASFSWQSQAQKTVALSNTKAEYMVCPTVVDKWSGLNPF